MNINSVGMANNQQSFGGFVNLRHEYNFGKVTNQLINTSNIYGLDGHHGNFMLRYKNEKGDDAAENIGRDREAAYSLMKHISEACAEADRTGNIVDINI